MYLLSFSFVTHQVFETSLSAHLYHFTLELLFTVFFTVFSIIDELLLFDFLFFCNVVYLVVGYKMTEEFSLA